MAKKAIRESLGATPWGRIISLLSIAASIATMKYIEDRVYVRKKIKQLKEK